MFFKVVWFGAQLAGFFFEVLTPVFLEMCSTCFQMTPEKQFSALFRKR